MSESNKESNTRHDASPRNRRKALHHAKCARNEVVAIRDMLSKMDDQCRYALGRLDRITNRLTSELKHDEKQRIGKSPHPPLAENSERTIQRDHDTLFGDK